MVQRNVGLRPPLDIPGANAVGTQLDVMRAAPTPAQQSSPLMLRRAITSPSGGNTSLQSALSQFLEIIFIYCEDNHIDIMPVFDNVMKANWTKYWTAEEAKKLPEGYKAETVGGIVVKNAAGKIMKPPSFKHP